MWTGYPPIPIPNTRLTKRLTWPPTLGKERIQLQHLFIILVIGLHHRMDARGGFFFQAAVSDKTGKVTKVHSDKSWRVAQAIAWDTSTKKRQSDFTIGMRERYDARLAYVDWQEPSFDDSDWESAKEIGVPPVEPWNQIGGSQKRKALL